MRAPAWVVLALLSVPISAQRPPIVPAPGQGVPPAPNSAVRPTEIRVTLEGCLEGSRLTLTDRMSPERELLKANEFALEGPKELMTLLAKEHDRHQEIITGIAIIPPSPDGATVD